MTDKRADILKAALKLVSEHGFHGTPMSKIAEEAVLVGFSEATTPEETFCRIWHNTFDFCIQNPQEMFFIEQYHNSPFLTPETEATTMQYLALLVDVFQVAIEIGEIKEISFEMLSIFANDVTVAFAKRHVS